MRVGLITASTINKVMCSTDEDKTAEVLVKGSSLHAENVSEPIKFGRTHEKKLLSNCSVVITDMGTETANSHNQALSYQKHYLFLVQAQMALSTAVTRTVAGF